MKAPKWTLQDASIFARDLQRHFKSLEVPCFVGLTGSTLYGDEQASYNDLDLIIYPTSSKRFDKERICEAMVSFGMKRRYDQTVVQERWRSLGSDDEKHVEVWAAPKIDGRKRIDIFFLQ